MDIQAIHKEAQTAAINAEQAFIAQHGEPMYCGFACAVTRAITAHV